MRFLASPVSLSPSLLFSSFALHRRDGGKGSRCKAERGRWRCFKIRMQGQYGRGGKRFVFRGGGGRGVSGGFRNGIMRGYWVSLLLLIGEGTSGAER